ncbi:alpha-rhamnosidase [Fusarium albosuccineum]|uniref:Alpha-rhamnosidase n=1 Tax=Fusarium albosuccineum TaxID=1237068 RepID=A0A8H4KDZ7_9HYPO|nr:alpha-rhamnosidase [Fusarium albosuccineum]
MSSPIVNKPRFEHHHNGFGVDTPTPRLSWSFEASESTVPAWVQTSYEVEVTFASDSQPQTSSFISDQSVLVPWPARPLSSGESATVRVRVYGKSLDKQHSDSRTLSAWSSPAKVEAALLDPNDFRGNFIAPVERIGPYGPLQPIRFRREFDFYLVWVSSAATKNTIS